MDNHEPPDHGTLSARQRLKNLCDALSEDDAYPERDEATLAAKVKHSVLQRLGQDARTQLTPSEILAALEQKPPAKKIGLVEEALAQMDDSIPDQGVPQENKVADHEPPPGNTHPN
jgi:hypothetical protein